MSLLGLLLACRRTLFTFHVYWKHTWPQRLTSVRLLASDDLLTLIFSLSFSLSILDFFRNFFSFCLEKIFWFDSPLSSRFFAHFLFSRSDSHTPGNYLRSHLGLRSTKILLWAVTLQIWREIGQIENQVPKREKNPKKIEKRDKIWYYEDRQKTNRCKSEVNLRGQVFFQWSRKPENCSFDTEKEPYSDIFGLLSFFDTMGSVSVNGL